MNLISLVDRIRAELDRLGSMTDSDLESVLRPGEDRASLDRALAFLHGRDEILVEIPARAVHLRSRVRDTVLRALADAGAPVAIDALARALDLPAAVLCDVLGWLEREGRTRMDASDQVALR